MYAHGLSKAHAVRCATTRNDNWREALSNGQMQVAEPKGYLFNTATQCAGRRHTHRWPRPGFPGNIRIFLFPDYPTTPRELAIPPPPALLANLRLRPASEAHRRC